jgi:Spy/CpxP family protein refolding chaperone
MRGGLQLGPPGRWWDDQDFASTLHLRADQQTHMDTIFAQNKATLLAHYDSLKDEERQLESMTRGANIDERTLFAHIDRVSQARAELEKANAHMLLQIRHELTPDQLNTLDEHRPTHLR